ncbi:MAG: hypothetical protein KF791_12455 [Verrucomicrobiae bacterium]|nr:hypothetical protein [Verrucomicrobiae bacterium]
MHEVDRLKYDALTRQLERMRAMQYAYHRKFFTLLLVSTLLGGFLLFLRTTAAHTLLVAGLISTGVSASFLLHFADFARTHARALEQRINRLLGERLLIASDLEAEYFYPHDAPRPPAPRAGWPSTFFNAYTLHFCLLWAAGIVLAGYRLWEALIPRDFLGIVAILLLWAALNAVYLRHWFRGAALHRMNQQLRAAYEPATSSDAPS